MAKKRVADYEDIIKKLRSGRSAGLDPVECDMLIAELEAHEEIIAEASVLAQHFVTNALFIQANEVRRSANQFIAKTMKRKKI